MLYKKLLCTALLCFCDENPLRIPVKGFYFTQFAGFATCNLLWFISQVITELDDNALHFLCF